MRMRWLFVALSVSLSTAIAAQEAPEASEASVEDFEASLVYQQGRIEVGDGLASLDLTPAFRYLNPAQAERLLVEGWGNPPGTETLGMLFPSDVSPLAPEGWGVIISYEEDGYVDDEDAAEIDYADLLGKMQEDTRAENEEREKAGYQPIELVGWAEPPRYDAEANKLYWAKHLRFVGEESDTLNYNIRVLGRRGVLVLNAVATMDQLPMIQSSLPELLPAIDFNPGNKYADFTPGTDKVAEYGIGALVAGTLAAKTGLFKALLAGLLAFKKGIIVLLVAGGAAAKKLFGKKRLGDAGA